MAHYSSDQKLELLHHIRMENQNDRMRMRQREQILYGNGTGNTWQIPTKSILSNERMQMPLAYEWNNTEIAPGEMARGRKEEQKFRGSFRVRMMLAVLLFGSYLFLEQGYIRTEFTGSQLMEVLNKDFSPKSGGVFFDFENSFPYTIFQ